MTRRETDVCVVGAGIVGLAHALEARRRGLRVIVLERSQRAVGASVRNFGHGFVTAMASGEPLACALRARRRWLELGRRAGITVRETGSLVLARHDDELAVMAALAADPERAARMITAAEAAAAAPIARGEIRGALHCTLDLRVDPRQAVAGLAALLAGDPGADVQWGTRLHAIEPGAAFATGPAGPVAVRAGAIVVCPGPEYASLPAELVPQRDGLTLCRLQMLRVAAPPGRRYDPALLTGLSLLRYPAFTELPGIERVRTRLAAERPELIAAGIHLIVTQLPGGDLILGDTHAYGDTTEPFGSERLDELVLAEARGLLGVERLVVRERWHGRYPTAPGDPFLIAAPMPGVRVVEVVAGVGMTTALGLAPATLDALLEPVARAERG